jgi:hypothetical protein
MENIFKEPMENLYNLVQPTKNTLVLD